MSLWLGSTECEHLMLFPMYCCETISSLSFSTPSLSFSLCAYSLEHYVCRAQQKLTCVVPAACLVAATCSAGNHAQGVALSAKKLNVRAVIVMPLATPMIKVGGVRLVACFHLLSVAISKCKTACRLVFPFLAAKICAKNRTCFLLRSSYHP